MKSLVIGMGIGQLYKSVLEKAGHTVVTVDTDREADYISLTDALSNHPQFDTAHVCTPNFTHFKLADQVAPYCRIVFIEKPGLTSAAKWQELLETHPTTRFMMVKNNQWRNEFHTRFKYQHDNSSEVWLRWINNNRVPSPGSWFTTKETAFGGVSRDLLPHLLSYVSGLCPRYEKLEVVEKKFEQRWTMADLMDTDYGTVVKDGVYNVDDRAELVLEGFGRRFHLIADWRSLEKDDISISFGDSTSAFRQELGLCPEQAYIAMIEEAHNRLNDADFWTHQLRQDLWIHNMMAD